MTHVNAGEAFQSTTESTLQSTSQSTSAASSTGAQFPIVIIGSGFAGIGMAIRLKQAGINSFTIFERATEIGGTWRDNTYPGAACDVPSHVYSFSFELNPHWSHMYAESEEIQSYLLRCVEKYGLRPHLRLNTAITEARFNEAEGVWILSTRTDGSSAGGSSTGGASSGRTSIGGSSTGSTSIGSTSIGNTSTGGSSTNGASNGGSGTGETVVARVVASGVGGLVNPKLPQIEGLENFQGKMFHTARWNHDYDIAGKRVAVIGTGASAVQVVPSIAPVVGKLIVFQRTPAWVVPRRDRIIRERAQRMFRRYPRLMRLRRLVLYAISEAMGPIIFLDSPRLSRIGERMSERHLLRCVSDPALRERLRPHFQFGCKRVLISDDYWPAFERENVELVTDSITEVLGDRIVTADGREHPVDAIVLATGFALNLTTAPFPIVGLEGATLSDTWRNGAVAYKGVTVSGFPNWFIMMGPNTGPGHTSVLVYTESQIEYTLQAIRRMIAEDIKYVTVRRDVQDKYNAGIQRRMRHMSWSSGCSSWYLSENGKNHALYPGLASEYFLRTRRFREKEYEVERAKR